MTYAKKYLSGLFAYMARSLIIHVNAVCGYVNNEVPLAYALGLLILRLFVNLKRTRWRSHIVHNT